MPIELCRPVDSIFLCYIITNVISYSLNTYVYESKEDKEPD